MFRELGTALKVRNCYYRILQASALVFLSILLMLSVMAPMEFVPHSLEGRAEQVATIQ